MSRYPQSRNPNLFILVLVALAAGTAFASKPPTYPSPLATGIVEHHARDSQISHGAYDPVSNRTFLVFSGCNGLDPCPVDPYIKYIDHDTGSWSGNLRLGASGGAKDSHYYPQIILDENRYLHVFNGLHANAPIQHYKSTVQAGHSQILSSSRWQQVGFGALDSHPQFNRATYPRAVKSNEGHIYLFYRQTLKGGDGNLDKDQQDWFEPQFYVRSTNNGATWEAPRLLFVAATAQECPSVSSCTDGDGADWYADGEEWDTIYIRGHVFDPDRNGVHFLFARTEHHDVYVDKHFYAFLDFDDLLVRDPQGFANGPFLTEDELTWSSRKYLFHDLPGSKTLRDGSQPQCSLAAGSGGIVAFLAHNYDPAPADRRIEEIRWLGSSWSSATCVAGQPTGCPVFTDWVEVEDAEMFDDGTYDLYLTGNYFQGEMHNVIKAHYDPDHGWSETAITWMSSSTDGYENVGLIRSPGVNAETTLTYMSGRWTAYENPRAIGKFYAWGPGDYLYAIKKQGSTMTESHRMDGARSFKQWSAQISTVLHKTGTNRQWEFELGDRNGDGVNDLWAIAKSGTASGKTEVHVLNGADGFQSFLTQTATILSQTGTSRAWEFELGDYNGDGKLDLWGIKRTNTGSGKVEVHILNGANGFQSFLAQLPTFMSQNGNGNRWDYELGDYDGDGKLDLYCVDKDQGSTNRPRVHVLSGASNFASRILNRVFAITTANGVTRWNYETGDYNADGVVDLYAIERSGTASGNTTVHLLDGDGDFQSFLLRTPTVLHGTGTTDAWAFLVGP